MTLKKVLVTMDMNLLIRIDEYLKEQNLGSSNRSAFLRIASENYLLLHKGLQNQRRRREIGAI